MALIGASVCVLGLAKTPRGMNYFSSNGWRDRRIWCTASEKLLVTESLQILQGPASSWTQYPGSHRGGGGGLGQGTGLVMSEG